MLHPSSAISQQQQQQPICASAESIAHDALTGAESTVNTNSRASKNRIIIRKKHYIWSWYLISSFATLAWHESFPSKEMKHMLRKSEMQGQRSVPKIQVSLGHGGEPGTPHHKHRLSYWFPKEQLLIESK
jgi:hypothetical protein